MTTDRHPDLLNRLWRTGSAGWTTVVLLVLIAAVLAVAFAFPQQPPGLDRVAAESWLAETAASYREIGATLAGMGAFTVLDGWLLRLLLSLLAFNLLLGLAERAERIGGTWSSVSDRGRWGMLGLPLLCLGLLVILLGLWINDLAGWRPADMALAAGSSSAVLPGTRTHGLRIRLDRVTGPEQAAMIDVTLIQAEGPARQMRLGPLPVGRWGNLWVYQQATGPALTVTAQDGEGHPLALQSLATGGESGPELHLLFRQNQSEQGFGLPTANLTFRAVSYPSLPEKGIARPVFLVEAYRGDAATPVLSQLVEDEVETTVDGVLLSLRRDRYVLLGAAYLPGWFVVAVGGLLALAGAIIALVSNIPLTSPQLSPTIEASREH